MLNDYTQIRQAAHWYTSKKRLPIIPLCSHNHENMSPAHTEKCMSAGKSPIISAWTQRTTTEVTEVEQWFEQFKIPNLGLPTGNTLDWNLVGIDIDGQFGEVKLQQVSNNDLPNTWEFFTAGGRRLLYALPPEIRTKKAKFTGKNGEHQELAFLVKGQQTVIPPSKHHTGFIYYWKEGHSPQEIDLAPAPDWLIAAVQIEDIENPLSDPTTEQDWTAPIEKGGRNNHLARLAGTLIAKKNVPKEQVLAFVKMWNKDHCVPPLPENEINQMVEAIYLSETQKKEKKKKIANGLKPSQAAIKFLEVQREEGWIWRYTSARGMFYRTNLFQGPWKPLSEDMATKFIAEVLVPANEEFDSTTKLKEVYKALQRHLTVNEDEGAIDDIFNLGKYSDIKYVQLENGMYDWNEKILSPWDPATMSTIQIGARYDEDLDCTFEEQLWKTTLEQWIPDLGSRAFLQEFLGYCLIPTCDFRTAVFLIGGGRNGKSLFLDTISTLFQNHLSVVPLERIGDRFETVQLIDSLLNICADVDIGYLPSTGTLKGLIAGDDMRAEHKFGKVFRFRPVTRYIFSANNLPKTRDKSEGWMSRWRFVNFPNTFAVAPNFKTEFLAQMTTKKGKQALLKWAIEGLRQLFTTKAFTHSDYMDRAAREYQHENDNVVAFLDTALIKVPHNGKDTMVAINILYHTYRQWTLVVGTKAVSQTDFAKRVTQVGFEKGARTLKGKSTMCILGVKLDPDFAELDLVVEYNMQLSMASDMR